VFKYFRAVADIVGAVDVELVGADEVSIAGVVDARSVGGADEGVAGGADTGWVVVADEDSVGGGGLAVQLTNAPAVANDATSIRSLIRCPVLGSSTSKPKAVRSGRGYAGASGGCKPAHVPKLRVIIIAGGSKSFVSGIAAGLTGRRIRQRTAGPQQEVLQTLRLDALERDVRAALQRNENMPAMGPKLCGQQCKPHHQQDGAQPPGPADRSADPAKDQNAAKDDVQTVHDESLTFSGTAPLNATLGRLQQPGIARSPSATGQESAVVFLRSHSSDWW